MVAIAFETIAVATAMPAAARDLDGLPWYGWAFSLFLIGMLLSTAVTGRLCDQIGPARPLMVGLAIFAVGLVAAGTATSMGQAPTEHLKTQWAEAASRLGLAIDPAFGVRQVRAARDFVGVALT